MSEIYTAVCHVVRSDETLSRILLGSFSVCGGANRRAELSVDGGSGEAGWPRSAKLEFLGRWLARTIKDGYSMSLLFALLLFIAAFVLMCALQCGFIFVSCSSIYAFVRNSWHRWLASASGLAWTLLLRTNWKQFSAVSTLSFTELTCSRFVLRICLLRCAA